MKILTLTFGSFAINTYIVYDPDTLECAIIDPGMMTVSEQRQIVTVIEANHLKPVHLINTHLHIDHIIGNDYISRKYDLGLEANILDAPLGERAKEQAQMFGLPLNPEIVPVVQKLNSGDVIKIGTGELKVIHVPGHSPGSIALYDAKDHFVITGDALFNGSIGRTDLPGGNHDQLIMAIKNTLMKLPLETRVFPGHGPATTIGSEKLNNPFLI